MFLVIGIISTNDQALPAFIVAKSYGKAFQRSLKTIGATPLFVSGDLDEGSIIGQNAIPEAHRHSAAGMAQAGRDVEKTVLA